MSKPLQRDVVEDLYRRYWFQVHRRCRRILGHEEQADDAAQEVFVRLISHGGAFRQQAEWMTWLYRVATNICLNRLRDRAKRGEAWREEVARHVGARAASSGEGGGEVAGVVQRELLRALLGRFDARTQQIVVYYYLDELDQEEIGQLMELSRVSVNKRIKKFRARAQQILESMER